MIFNHNQIERDKEGYLINHSDWSEELADLIAREDCVTLTEEHWKIIHFVREFYFEYHTSPAIRLLVKLLKESYGPETGNSIYLQRLFPKGPAKQVSKIAGLPKPIKCL
ncbi:TusE/DsrC/DsvC family sulfur relay protein [Thorsellia kenyensis]|uniref:Sulfurtransferase n=1 Tax=Thorsellia kenyensis TaxID=1549888 RepID=A0ABV6C9E9_9GAMM